MAKGVADEGVHLFRSIGLDWFGISSLEILKDMSFSSRNRFHGMASIHEGIDFNKQTIKFRTS